jgi:hypothetical protein
MAKIHRLITVTPIVSGSDIQALCGEIVQKASATLAADFDFSEMRHTVAFCKDCFGPILHYMIMSGQEARDIEA